MFAGAGVHCYYEQNLASRPELTRYLGELQRFIAVEKDFLSTRVSYRLNLKGPSITIQTACSTSLVAVHLGCQSLLNGESDMVLAGGISIRLPQIAGYLYQEGAIVSPDGHCRAFDAMAEGTVFGSGAGIVVLKRLADAVADGDCIHAVISGSCINNDGAVKVGYTAPSVEGQARVIAEAQAMAGVTGDDITYVETHGTGTKLGDPIEIVALTQAFRRTTQNSNFCAIGSLKTNLGHLDTAAGIAGLIKITLALEHRTLPPSLNFNQPNPAIDFATSPFHVQRTLTDWKPANGRRVAGVSSFGIGGTNAHVVVEEFTAASESDQAQPWQLLTLSARTPGALEKNTDQLAEFLSTHKDVNLADVALTLQQGRKPFAHRRVVAAKDIEDAIELLKTRNPRRVRSGKTFDGDSEVVFMFPAQGAQHPNMARDLYETETVFRKEVDRCAAHLKARLSLDIRSILYPSDKEAEQASERLRQTRFTQPAVFVVNYALARLWMSWGIKPAAMVGHSLGEYVAATLAGVFELEDALDLVAERARLMQELPRGGMLAVHLSEEALKPWLREDLSLAAVNAPGLTAVSGPLESIERLQTVFLAENVESQVLHTSHAFHSAMMEPMVAPFVELVARVPRHTPQTPFVSTLTGTWITAEQAVDPGYWGQQTRYGVRFSPAVLELMKKSGRALLEVGPGNSLSTLARLHLTAQSQCAVVNSLPHAKEDRSDRDCIMSALGLLWLTGVRVSWSQLNVGEHRCRLPLPTYPFERKRFWIDAKPAPISRLAASAIDGEMSSEGPSGLSASPEKSFTEKTATASTLEACLPRRLGRTVPYVAPQTEGERSLAKIWQEVLGIEEIGMNDNFFELGGHSLMAVTLVSEMGRALGGRFSLASLITAPTIREFVALAEREQPPRQPKREFISTTAIAQQVRSFVVENYLFGQANGLKNSDSLRKHGIIDEMGILQLVDFLEEKYGIKVPDEMLTSARMDSIDSVSVFVQQRLNRGQELGISTAEECVESRTA